MDDKNQFHTVRGYQLLKQEENALTPAMEDYLEMIYRHSLETGLLRANTLSDLLNVHPSSVTKMLQKLDQFGYVDYQKYGIIFLTEKGRRMGEFLYNRHQIIENFLLLIGISDNVLEETELIEHHISPRTLSNIALFNRFIHNNPDFTERFEIFMKKHKED